MAKLSEQRTATERFGDLFREMEQTDAYHIDGVRVEISKQIFLAMKR